ncbi:MAG: hypothetical protein AAF483_00450 [Planctomycetota bacterium]
MSESNHREVGSRLREQSARLAPECIEAPVDQILGRFRRRRMIRRCYVGASALAVLLVGIFFVNRALDESPQFAEKEAQSSNEEKLESPTLASAQMQSDLETGESFAELLNFVSLQAGVEAHLIIRKDENGTETPVIYIPPALLPMSYENLDTAEQEAVLRVLNQSTEQLNSI